MSRGASTAMTASSTFVFLDTRQPPATGFMAPELLAAMHLTRHHVLVPAQHHMITAGVVHGDGSVC